MNKEIINKIKNNIENIHPAINLQLKEKKMNIIILCLLLFSAFIIIWFLNSTDYNFSQENNFIIKNSTTILYTFENDISKTKKIIEFTNSEFSFEMFKVFPKLNSKRPDAITVFSKVKYILKKGVLLRKVGNRSIELGKNIKSFILTPYDINGNETKNVNKMISFSLFIEFIYTIKGESKIIPMKTRAFSRYLNSKKRYPEHFSFIDDNKGF